MLATSDRINNQVQKAVTNYLSVLSGSIALTQKDLMERYLVGKISITELRGILIDSFDNLEAEHRKTIQRLESLHSILNSYTESQVKLKRMEQEENNFDETDSKGPHYAEYKT